MSFGMTSTQFLSHIFDVSGVRLSDVVSEGIQELPNELTYVKRVRSFIGMVNHYRDFIKGLSTYMIPLTALQKWNLSIESFGSIQDDAGGLGCFCSYSKIGALESDPVRVSILDRTHFRTSKSRGRWADKSLQIKSIEDLEELEASVQK